MTWTGYDDRSAYEQDRADDARRETERQEAADAAMLAEEQAGRERSPGDSATDAEVIPPPEFNPETGEVLESAPTGYWVDGRLTSNDALDWAGGRMRDKEALIAENERLAEAERTLLMERVLALDARLEASNRPIKADLALLENACKVYAETHRAELLKGLHPKAKTRKLPNITVAWKTREAGHRIDQRMTSTEARAALLAWAIPRTGPTTPLTRLPTERVLDLDKVKAYAEWMRSGCSETGEIYHAPPGLEYVPESETLTITTGGKKP
jgi:hypothetical protein